MPATPVRTAILLAGGPATRLGDLAKNCPKPWLEVGGEPFVFRHFRALRDFGVKNIILAAGSFADFYEKNLGSEIFGIKIQIVPEPKRLETGGATRLAFDFLPDDGPVFLLNGDDFCPGGLEILAEKFRPGVAGVLAVAEAADAGAFETVEALADGRIRRMVPRSGRAEPGLFHAGWDLFDPVRVREFFPAGGEVFKLEAEVTGPHAAEFLAAKVPEHFEIGRPETLAAARARG